MQRKEVWKPIKGYEGIYEVSNFGRIRNIHFGWDRKIYKSKLGYHSVVLCKENKIKRFAVHRLVYQAFVGEIPEKHVIHHIDHNPSNNHLDNLQLMSGFEHNSMHKKGNIIPAKYNQTKEAIEKRKKKVSKPTAQLSFDGKIIKVYPSTIEASRQTNVDRADICRCCKGKKKTAGGYKWKYSSDITNFKQEKLDSETQF